MYINYIYIHKLFPFLYFPFKPYRVMRHPIHFHISMKISALRNYTITSWPADSCATLHHTRSQLIEEISFQSFRHESRRSINERSSENNDEKWDELDWVTAFREGCGKEKRDICTWKSTTSEVNEFGSC